jgi:hypothetical protein
MRFPRRASPTLKAEELLGGLGSRECIDDRSRGREKTYGLGIGSPGVLKHARRMAPRHAGNHTSGGL